MTPTMVYDALDLDEKYFHFHAKRKELVFFSKSLALSEESRIQLNVELTQISSEREVSDWAIHLKRLMAESSSDGASSSDDLSTTKRPRKADPIEVFKKFGINKFASNFGISALELGRNVRDSYQAVVPSFQSLSPIDRAQEWIETELDEMSKIPQSLLKPDNLLASCRNYLSFCVSSEIHVRQSMRFCFKNYATISTKPTRSGLRAIDLFHLYAKVKKIDAKPLRKTNGEQFLLMLKAEKAGLLEIEIDVSPADYKLYFLDELKRFYCSDKISSIDQLWDQERTNILDMALKKWLFPLFVQETRQTLTKDGIDRVADAYEKRLVEFFLFFFLFFSFCWRV